MQSLPPGVRRQEKLQDFRPQKTLPETNIAPENGWLENQMFFWDGPFLGDMFMSRWIALDGMYKKTMYNNGDTLPETSSSHLKMDGWKTFSFPSGKTYFQVRTVSFREGIVK